MRRRAPWAILAGALLACLMLIALGTWQLQRRTWKHDLITRVAARVHAAPAAPPAAALWSALSASQDEYRHVQISGEYLPVPPVYVQALTDLGAGFWVLSPLRDAQGHTLLINRGFIPNMARGATAPVPAGLVTINGLLRLSEPGGRWLRRNDATGGHWFSRDVAAIGAAQHWTALAPFFIDVDASSPPTRVAATATSSKPGAAQPVGGLTVTHFADNHLIYALTWYTLALMVAGGMMLIVRESHRA